MRKSRLWGLLVGAALVGSVLVSCTAQETAPVGELIYEERVSPNENYVDTEDAIVEYSVQVYQTQDKDIVVVADSNSSFFEETQYVVEYDQPLSAADVSILWTTLMGSTEATEEDQLGVALVSISDQGEVFSQKKIHFIGKGAEIVVDVLSENQASTQ